MVEGQAHVNFSEIDPGITKTLHSLGNLVLPNQDLIGSYSEAISTSFFEVYIGRNASYRPFLKSAYAEYLSQEEEFKLDLITGDSSAELIKSIETLSHRNSKRFLTHF